MPHMSTFTTCFFLLILILALPRSLRGESEIYEIDYRGPETHSSVVPPPHHFHIGKPKPQKGSVRGTKALALRDTTYIQNNKVKKVHG
ncbi:uncharacterized protein LOC109805260 [Cajanus cajan]|uniref:uncharacterized protein LOC109805260 n=1 Tax=Cajanus cajan TaxID=3821 RepID=UPI0010FAD03C|nr:uncharacterized protein LOC109805260 [Cajanus cajan]